MGVTRKFVACSMKGLLSPVTAVEKEGKGHSP